MVSSILNRLVNLSAKRPNATLLGLLLVSGFLCAILGFAIEQTTGSATIGFVVIAFLGYGLGSAIVLLHKKGLHKKGLRQKGLQQSR